MNEQRINELKELAATPEDGDSGMSQETAERIHAAICADVDKVDLYAATACACYGRILDGKVPGVPKENIDAGIMTALVVAGMEKASILVRLARGEIDAELAKEMLDALNAIGENDVLECVMIGDDFYKDYLKLEQFVF